MEVKNLEATKNDETNKPKLEIVWFSVFYFLFMHIAGLYGVYLGLTSARFYTIIWAYFMFVCGTVGITAGSHRLWSHRSYKARTPLRILLTVFTLIAFQHSIYQWARNHRVHHKYSDTNADPYNVNRGFFFAQVGWVMCRKHPDVVKKGRGIDVSDLKADKLIMWQDKYYIYLSILVCYLIPTIVPIYFWQESFKNAFCINAFRFCWTFDVVSFINSIGHWNGLRPYDRSIRPVENVFVSILNLGECWHNFHHAFPWDYKAGEFSGYGTNFSASFIELMAKIGWAYDLKFATDEIIKNRVNNKGDGTHKVIKTLNEDALVDSLPNISKWF